MTWIQTYTGKQFYPCNPRVSDIDIEDIAHALSLLCRFTGHCKQFYSVAQHSVLAAAYCDDYQLWALLHDASEAYVSDVAKPIKGQLAGYEDIETGVMAAIAARFNLTWPMPAEIKLVDSRLLATEQRDLMNPCAVSWSGMSPPYPNEIQPWSSDLAKHVFLEVFRGLTEHSGIIGDGKTVEGSPLQGAELRADLEDGVSR